MATSGQRLKNALKTAASLPVRAVRGSSTSLGHFSRTRHAFSPAPGETPIVILRLQVVSCTGLLPKDKNGHGDPFVVVSLLHSRRSTPTCKRTLNPTFPARESTFDFPIYLSVVEKMGGVGVIELVVWDRDILLKKECLGEVGVSMGGWFRPRGSGTADSSSSSVARALGWDDGDNKPISLALESARANTTNTTAGSVLVKIGFVNPPNTVGLLDFEEVLGELRKREGRGGRESWASAPPTRGVGTIRSHHEEPELSMAYGDDGGLSSADEYEPEDEEGSEAEEGLVDEPIKLVIESPTTPMAISPGTPATATMPISLAKTLVPPPPILSSLASPPPQKSSGGFIPKMKFPRRKAPTADVSSTSTGAAEGSASETNAEPQTKEKEKKKRVFRKRWSTGSSGGNSGPAALTPLTLVGDVPTPITPVNEVQQGYGSESVPATVSPASTPVATSKGDYMLEAANDIVGIVMLEIIKAENLPKLKNVTRTGFDMDPFVVISCGKKVFRTRVLRHTLNPVWDEKLLFHVRRHETAFQVVLTILDWDKLSSNDLVGGANFEIASLVALAPQPDPTTGLYAPDYGGDHPMKEMKLDLTMAKDIPWELTKDAPTPMITIRAKYQSYAALRQRFWRQYLTQYDTDDTGAISRLELTSMLDSLGSTLTRSTIESFFVRYGKNVEEDELTVDEAIQCLEAELCRPLSEKQRLELTEEEAARSSASASASATPLLTVMDKLGKELDGAMQESVSFALNEMHELDFSGRPAHPQHHLLDVGGWFHHQSEGPQVQGQPRYPTEPNQMPLSAPVDSSEEEENGSSRPSATPSSSAPTSGAATDSEVGQQKKLRFRRIRKKKKKTDGGSSSSANSGTPTTAQASNEAQVERVINVKNCPLCHRPRLNSKAEVDIVTHLAVCASQDWNQVDRIVVGNFVTASQAQRKWYTNVLDRIYAGQYRVGANSANIIVQDRITGQLEEEKMQVYVRIGIRLLYKGAGGRMEGSRARGLLKSLSIKQGLKYDSQESAKEIPSFIQFHQLNVDEILNPIESYKTFNQFFYRKLKPDARPVEQSDDPCRLVSIADCRLMTFETVSEATKIWIKGREFTVGRLLGDNYKDEAEKYVGGALGVFRLAPQDYHRFHCPVDGTIGRMTYISGEYYTVNPQAIRTALDVYGENVRKIVPIDSPQFGRVMAVCIGAMMVGTIKTTVEEGQQVRRGQEFGYFAFGGSTIVLLFEKDVLEWDEDLLINGRASLETLVRVGMGVGKGRRPAAT